MKTVAVRRFHEQPVSMRVLKWVVVPALAVHIVLATISGYRAIVQVYRLDLRSSERVLHSGSTVGFTVVTSARTHVDVELELRQGTRAETLAVKLVPGNVNASYDPRTKWAKVTVVLSPEQLARLDRGPAILRATANGRSQWLRTPPPKIQELAVDIQPQ